MPLATLPLELAAGLGALLGQLFMVGAFAWALQSMRVPRPWWFVLALPALGTLFLQRLEMLRPHVWLIGFTALVIALLVERRWKTLLVVCALFGLTHTGGWIAIPIAALWSLAGIAARDVEEEARRRTAFAALVPWQPPAAAAGGWLLGQLVHPEVPANFQLFFIANFVVPFQATAAGNAALKSQLGTELLPPGALDRLRAVAGVPRCRRGGGGAAAAAPPAQPRHPHRGAARARLPARRHAGDAPLPRARRAAGAARPGAGGARGCAPRALAAAAVGCAAPVAAAAVIAPLLIVTHLRGQGYGRHSAPLAMARWLGAHAAPGERVFTAQWADSAPLFYAAPQLQSLVALDPTVFHAKDPQRFERYVAVVQGRAGDPARVIREVFGCRWVTLWRVPSYQALTLQLRRSPGIRVAYEDRDYLVLDLGPAARG